MQLRFEIDVQPFGVRFARFNCTASNDLFADSLPAKVRMHHRIEQESMRPAVPCDIGETDEPLARIGADVDKAATQHRTIVAGRSAGPPGSK